jgi:hypothetical protein
MTRRVTRVGRRLREALPQGQLLPDGLWRRRQRGMVLLLCLHVPALFVFAVARGNPPWHALVDVAPNAILAMIAGTSGLPRRVRAAATAAGLVTCSAVLVHLWGGRIEGHFHFFVVVSLMILFQDWVPFLIAIGFVVLHHGVVGTLLGPEVFDHSGGLEQPWLWAAVHGGFILALSAANMIAWRANEQLVRDPPDATRHARRAARPPALRARPSRARGRPCGGDLLRPRSLQAHQRLARARRRRPPARARRAAPQRAPARRRHRVPVRGRRVHRALRGRPRRRRRARDRQPHRRAGAGTAGAGGRSPPRARVQRARAALPAGGVARIGPRGSGRGARALAPPRPRSRPARRVHRRGGGHRADRAARRLGARRGVLPGSRLARLPRRAADRSRQPPRASSPIRCCRRRSPPR